MRTIRVFLGQTGGGKSWRLRQYIDVQPRVVIYDTLGDPDYDSYERVGTFKELCDLLIANPPIFRVAYTWPADDGVSQEDDFDRVCEAVYCCRNIVLAVEEVAMFCNPNFLPIPLRKIVALGRHRDLSMYCTSQTPPQVHNLIRSQAHQIVSFNQTEPGHVAWCRAVIGPSADLLPTLKPHHALVWDRGVGVRMMSPDWRPMTDLDGQGDGQEDLPLDSDPGSE